MTNRKSHVSFRLTPRSMTLDDPELLGSNFVGIWRDFAILGGNSGITNEDGPVMSAIKL